PIAWKGACGLNAILALFCTGNALLFDIPDREEDRKNGTPTLVVRRGLRVVKMVCAVLSLSGIVWSLLGPVFPQARLGLVLLGAALFGAARTARYDARPSTIAWWIDGALLLPLLTV